MRRCCFLRDGARPLAAPLQNLTRLEWSICQRRPSLPAGQGKCAYGLLAHVLQDEPEGLRPVGIVEQDLPLPGMQPRLDRVDGGKVPAGAVDPLQVELPRHVLQIRLEVLGEEAGKG